MAEQEQSSTRVVVLAEWRRTGAVPAHRAAPLGGAGLGASAITQGIAVLRGEGLHPALRVRHGKDAVEGQCHDARVLAFPSAHAWRRSDGEA